MNSDKNKKLLIFAWISTLLVSSLPNILWQEYFGTATIWLLWAKIILLFVFLLIALFWKTARGLWPYYVLVMILFLAEEAMGQLGNTAFWQTTFAQTASFGKSMLGHQLRRLLVTLCMIIGLFLIYRKPKKFFMVKGNLKAPAAKEGFLIDEGTPWHKLGWILALCITLGTLAFLWIAGRPSLRSFPPLLAQLPMILLLAAMNAFSEELSYRAAFLAPLNPVTGKMHAILLTATFFGLAHFYGVPYGIIGVIMSFVLGYLLSKSMLETRGFFWAWFIHFLQDVAIFSFMALSVITPGGA